MIFEIIVVLMVISDYEIDNSIFMEIFNKLFNCCNLIIIC